MQEAQKQAETQERGATGVDAVETAVNERTGEAESGGTVDRDDAASREPLPGGKASPDGEASSQDDLADLRSELEQVQTREAEYLDGWQRARAELANARKRFQREQEQAWDNARADVLGRLLPIVDDFERAFETVPQNLSALTWIEGIGLIRRKLQVLLDQSGVGPIEAVGEPFDPFLHQAVTHEPSEAVPEGNVIAELQKGYRIGERVLRPSMVRVSSGQPASPEDEPGAGGGEAKDQGPDREA